jgi:hypothetical protein
VEILEKLTDLRLQSSRLAAAETCGSGGNETCGGGGNETSWRRGTALERLEAEGRDWRAAAR